MATDGQFGPCGILHCSQCIWPVCPRGFRVDFWPPGSSFAVPPCNAMCDMMSICPRSCFCVGHRRYFFLPCLGQYSSRGLGLLCQSSVVRAECRSGCIGLRSMTSHVSVSVWGGQGKDQVDLLQSCSEPPSTSGLSPVAAMYYTRGGYQSLGDLADPCVFCGRRATLCMPYALEFAGATLSFRDVRRDQTGLSVLANALLILMTSMALSAWAVSLRCQILPLFTFAVMCARGSPSWATLCPCALLCLGLTAPGCPTQLYDDHMVSPALDRSAQPSEPRNSSFLARRDLFCTAPPWSFVAACFCTQPAMQGAIRSLCSRLFLIRNVQKACQLSTCYFQSLFGAASSGAPTPHVLCTQALQFFQCRDCHGLFALPTHGGQDYLPFEPAAEQIFCPGFLLPLPFNVATRVGEASHPGPQSDIRHFFAPQQVASSCSATPPSKGPSTQATQYARVPSGSAATTDVFTVAVANPTSVTDKSHLLVGLGAQLLFLSETSAIAQAQETVGKDLRRLGFSTVWGKPVDPHVSPKTGLPTLRGHAVGVAICSSLPLTQALLPLAPDVHATQRVAEGMIRLGNVQVRVIAWYGFPSSHVEAKSRNDCLLRMILDRVALSRVPTLIGGDANTRVQDLPAWEHFRYLGYQEYFELHAHRFGEELPPTCRRATRHDTLLIPPLLQGMLVSGRVDVTSKSFDCHDPLLVQFTTQPAAPVRTWRMPRPWTDYRPDMQQAAAIYAERKAHVRDIIHSCQTPEEVSGAFETWARAVEDSVDASIRLAHAADPVAQPHVGLPRTARGRCIRREKVPLPPAHLPCRARQGDYNPPCEAVSMRSRRQVKQVRRLVSLQLGLTAFHRSSPPGAVMPRTTESRFMTEWNVIKKNKAFGPRFESWILGFPPFDHFWVHLPPLQWLGEVIQFTKHVCESQLRFEAKVRDARFKYLVQLDCDLNGQKMGFAQLRPRPRPPVSCLPVTETRDALKAEDASTGSVLYEVPHPQFLRVHSPVLTDAGPAMVDEVLTETQGERADMIRMTFAQGPAPDKCRLRQHTQAVTGVELHREFVNYWVDIWWRDSRDQARAVEKWPQFLQELPPRPPEACEVQVDMRDVTLWKQALRRLRPQKATGYDGFSPGELKGLQDRPLEDLAELFHVAVLKGYPAHLAQAKVYTLAKKDDPKSFADGRPITIFATIYRLWASILAREVLRVWASWMPLEVSGSMPGRCSNDVAYSLQAAIEEALLSGAPLGGFSLDITKCFNMIPRAPAAHLMRYLGMPASLVATWQRILEVSEKSPVLAGGLEVSMGATTGVPEGDALSVVAMAAICWLIVSKNRSTHAHMHTYVDNFSWLARSKSALTSSLCLAQKLCDMLRLPIDWKKSFAWATTPALKVFWDKEAQQYLPEGVTLARVRDAKDLGVHFQFQSRRFHTQPDKRLEEGKQRLDKLRKQPRPIFKKVHLLLSGIWPQALFGQEGRLLPRAVLDHLRSKAARALCHTGPSQSALLVLSTVAPPKADPEVFLLIQAAVALRRAFVVQPDVALRVLQVASQADAESRVVGPATAFARMCAKAGWEVSDSGWCHGPGMHTFSVRHSSRRQISSAIQQAWLHEVSLRVSHRNGLHSLGALSAIDTSYVIKTLPSSQQRGAVNCVAGGHMSASAQALWNPTVTAECRFCGSKDTKFHRVFECPFYAQVRSVFAPMLQWVRHNSVHWIHAACITEHPDHDVLRLIFRARPHVPPGPLLPPCSPHN